MRLRERAIGNKRGEEGVSGKWTCFNIKDNCTQDPEKTLHLIGTHCALPLALPVCQKPYPYKLEV